MAVPHLLLPPYLNLNLNPNLIHLRARSAEIDIAFRSADATVLVQPELEIRKIRVSG
jgi:hypothetical protein